MLVQIQSQVLSINDGGQTSLIAFCSRCPDNCCSGRTGRTLLTDVEREAVLASGHRDYSISWEGGWSYLEATECEYFLGGRCSIHSAKPFACRVFPFVPRLVADQWWLFLVTACYASPDLDSGFTQAARHDAVKTLPHWDTETYKSYWLKNKQKDFSGDRILLLVPVFPNTIINLYGKEVDMELNEVLMAPGCVKTTVREIAKEPEFQVLRVSVENGGEIPLHTHDCAATMLVVSGQARTLGKDGRVVRPGDVIAKKPGEPHGFTDAVDDFAFLSVSSERGILRGDGWDLQFV